MKLKPALLVIDIQNEFLNYVPERDRGVGLWMINATIALFREYGFPVVRVYHTDPQRGPAPGTEPFEFPAGVAVRPDDPRIIKNYPNAFKKTELEKLLRDMECNTVFVTGLSAVMCALATYHAAKDLEFSTFMVKDAIMSHNSAYTGYVEQISDTVGYSALQLMLKAAAD
ncbi:MAG: isochorismatase family protein [Candidatus Eisenbacteria bacterium]|jgi:nicotinamidase-related amidase|nr:isochorismatase family protein [Candidatus Eisenbacteria bacterium]